MGKTRIFKQVEIDKIIELYISKKISNTHQLAEIFSTSHKTISNILKKNDIKINSTGGQKKYFNEATYRDFLEDYQSQLKEGYRFVAICKATTKIFKDYSNSSGVLTQHLLSLYPNIDIPTQHYRKEYAKENNKFWHEQYFDITQLPVVKAKTKKCMYCDWETADTQNLSGWYQVHLQEKHKIDLDDYIKEFPEELSYFKKYEQHIEHQKFLFKEGNSIECKICGKKFQHIPPSHLATHNMTTTEYKEKFGDCTMSKKVLEYKRDLMIRNNKTVIVPFKISKPELKIREFLEQNNIKYSPNNKTILSNGKEIDILMEEKKIGIEFNGNKWHTEFFGGKTRYSHVNKTKECNKFGYDLIQIFEDEFMYKNELVFQKLSHILKIDQNKTKIGARKCEIKEVTCVEKNDFLNKFHIQGEDVNSSIKLGAFYKEKLVGVMCFCRINKSENNYELTRFATDYDYIISGLGSKMLSKFIETFNPDNIISFADRRWTLNCTNNLYIKMGFVLVDTLLPDYKYYCEKIDRYKRYHKFGFRKKILHKKYGLPIDLTETEMIKTLGYDKIWDCGLFKYELNLKNTQNHE